MKFIHYILLFLIIFSCKKEDKPRQEKGIEKSDFSISVKHNKILPIKNIFKEDVKTWEELTSLEVFLKQFDNISVNEALGSASDLLELAKSLKDSVIPGKFNKAPFIARVNIFYNETLRLADMYAIEDVDFTEANAQIEKVIDTYSAINTKINSVLEEERLERLIDVNLQNTVIDSATRDVIKIKSFDKNKTKQVDK